MWHANMRPTAFVERYFLLILWTLLGAYAVGGTVLALVRWRRLRGWEPEWIAQGLASGHAYSLDGPHRWLFDQGAADQYFASAWVDPLFPAVYVVAMILFGEASRLVVVLFLLACFVAAAAFATLTARRIAGPWAGLITLVVLVASVRTTSIAINASLMAGVWVSLLAFYLVQHAERLNMRAALVLGAVLGLSVLTWSSTMIFAPVLVLLLFRFAPAPPQALKMSAAMVLVAVLMVAPWSLRNYVVFDAFVPVRNGLGLLAYVGTAGLTKTFAPERVATPVPAPWASSDPFVAVARIMGPEPFNRRALDQNWRMQVMATQLGPKLDAMNEAQRDKWLLHEARDMVLANPLLTAQLAAAKLTAFVRQSWLPLRMGPVVTVFAIAVCAVWAFWRGLLLVPVALTLAYMAPFTIIVPYFYRYRYPIEPIIAVLAGVALVCVAETVAPRIRPRLATPRPAPDLPPARARAGDRRSAGRSTNDPLRHGGS